MVPEALEPDDPGDVLTGYFSAWHLPTRAHLDREYGRLGFKTGLYEITELIGT